MDFQIHANLPYSHLGLLFLFYYLLMHTRLPRYIRRAALIYHRSAENKAYFIVHGKPLYEDIYAIDEEKVVDVEEEKVVDVEEVKEVEEVKFEEKYLTAFKSFSNDYFFTEEELQEKADKRKQLVADFNTSYIADIDNLTLLLSESQKIISLYIRVNVDNLEEVYKELIKYFELNNEPEDDFDFDELLNDLKNDHNRFKNEIKDLLEYGVE